MICVDRKLSFHLVVLGACCLKLSLPLHPKFLPAVFIYYAMYRFSLSAKATPHFSLSHLYPYQIDSSALNIWVYLQSHYLFTVSASVCIS